MSEFVLVTARVDWADEFDCKMFGVFTKEDWNERKAEVEKYFTNSGTTVVICFGTNEFLEVDSYENWLRNCNIKPLSEPEAKVLNKYFNGGNKLSKGFTFGTGDGYFETSRFSND